MFFFFLIFLQNLCDLDVARKNYERALHIHETTYGPNHTSVATDVINLGSLLKDFGDLDGARTKIERGYRIFRDRLGDEHPNTKIAKRHLDSLPPAS